MGLAAAAALAAPAELADRLKVGSMLELACRLERMRLELAAELELISQGTAALAAPAAPVVQAMAVPASAAAPKVMHTLVHPVSSIWMLLTIAPPVAQELAALALVALAALAALAAPAETQTEASMLG
jgi:hypothetical protein